ncbi:MAG: hypothetical protein M0Z42_00745 [Actinomycetota bacterium]|nr:hypothetical protein [Actinomycetota bacterium]
MLQRRDALALARPIRASPVLTTVPPVAARDQGSFGALGATSLERI